MLNPKVTICQFKISDNKETNILNAIKYIKEANDVESNIVVLPECFVCPYSTELFDINSEEELERDKLDKNSALYNLYSISELYSNIYIFAGSIIEKDFNEERTEYKLYNTCYVFHNGKILGKYRKN